MNAHHCLQQCLDSNTSEYSKQKPAKRIAHAVCVSMQLHIFWRGVAIYTDFNKIIHPASTLCCDFTWEWTVHSMLPTNLRQKEVGKIPNALGVTR